METKLKIIVPDNYNPGITKLSIGIDLSRTDIVRQSELCEKATGKAFGAKIREVCQKNFGFFGSGVEKKINEIIATANE